MANKKRYQNDFFKRPVPIVSNWRNVEGFTFIEIIVSLALLSILTAIFGMGLVAAMNSYAFSRTNADIAQKGQLAIQRISRELTELTDINAIGSDFVFYNRIDNDPSGNPSLLAMGLCYDPAADQIVFYRDIPGVLTCPSSSDTGNVLIDGVLNFNLDDHVRGEQTFAITLTLGLSRPDAPATPQSFTQMVHMRNNGNQGGAV